MLGQAALGMNVELIKEEPYVLDELKLRSERCKRQSRRTISPKQAYS